MKPFTEDDVRDKIRTLAELRGGVRALAKYLSISPSYVCDVMNGRRAPGPPFLDALGLRKVVGYLYKASGQ